MTHNTPDFALVSNRVVTPEGVRPAAILIREGRILDVVAPTALPDGLAHESFGDLVLLPGLVDTHIHINEPGRTEWEGFDTATRAAAAGGVTTLVDMPLNSSPVTTTTAAFAAKRAAAKDKLWVDVGFWGGVVPENINDLKPLSDDGVLGFKAFMVNSGIDEFGFVSEDDLKRAMPIIRDTGLTLLAHAEVDLGAPDLLSANPTHYQAFLASRPPAWEDEAVALLLRLSRSTNCPVHIVHLASAGSLAQLREARAEGVAVTVETCPHYLCLSAEQIPDGATEYKCCPPIRDRANQDQLWQGLLDGTIDCIVSDHSPCPPAMKLRDQGNFQAAWGGIASIQLGLSVVWTQAHARGIPFEKVSAWMSDAPARTFGLERKGRIAPGFDADLVVWDPNVQTVLSAEALLFRHPVSPFVGQNLRGQVETTFLRGTAVYRREVGHVQRRGQPLLRQEITRA